MAIRLDACIAQHQGDRKEQQDRVALVAHRTRPGVALAVVADGMGGHTGGALAAEQVIHTVSTNFQHFAPADEEAHQLLHNSLLEAHTMIKASRYINEKDPHSTAVVLMLLPGNRTAWAHCGDSRLYHFRNGVQLTRTLDHSYVEHLVRQGKITPQEAEIHPNRNILLTSLGGREDPKVEFGTSETIQGGDAFLLCSDGLWAYFSSEELGQIIQSMSAREASARLIELARERARGEGDNVSLALLRFVEEPKKGPAPRPGRP